MDENENKLDNHYTSQSLLAHTPMASHFASVSPRPSNPWRLLSASSSKQEASRIKTIRVSRDKQEVEAYSLQLGPFRQIYLVADSKHSFVW